MAKTVLSPDTNGKIRYPSVNVDLSNCDGNAFSILGRVSKEMRRAGVSDNEVSVFTKEAMSSDYDNLLQTCMRWVDVS
jgi:hypothetical protein